MKWIDILKEWNKGNIPKYDNKIKKSFFWETSPINNKMNNEFDEKFIESDILNKMKQNYLSFEDKIKKTNNKNVLSFYNLSKTSKLVIPYPKKGKKFTTLKQFMDNASLKQQKLFWKKVVSSIKSMLKKYDKVWISTHGTGVPYLHVRIDTYPKYYLTKKFRNR